MKKLLVTAALALAAAAVSAQPASAWWKFNFGYGFNFGVASGNNSLLWGLWYNGQAPGYPGHYPVLGAIYGPVHFGPLGHEHHHGFAHEAAGGYYYDGHGFNNHAATPSPAPHGSDSTHGAEVRSWNYGYGYSPVTYYPSHWYGR